VTAFNIRATLQLLHSLSASTALLLWSHECPEPQATWLWDRSFSSFLFEATTELHDRSSWRWMHRTTRVDRRGGLSIIGAVAHRIMRD
jgi:hypothetical protein